MWLLPLCFGFWYCIAFLFLFILEIKECAQLVMCDVLFEDIDHANRGLCFSLLGPEGSFSMAYLVAAITSFG